MPFVRQVTRMTLRATANFAERRQLIAGSVSPVSRVGSKNIYESRSARILSTQPSASLSLCLRRQNRENSAAACLAAISLREIAAKIQSCIILNT